MVSVSDILSIVFGLEAVILGIGAIWAACRRNGPTTTNPDPDLELGSLNCSPATLELDSTSPTDSDIAGLGDRSRLQLISDAMEVILRLIQAHNRTHGEYSRSRALNSQYEGT